MKTFVAIMGLVLASLITADTLLALYGLESGHSEANFLLAWVLDVSGYAGFLVVKFISLLALSFVVWAVLLDAIDDLMQDVAAIALFAAVTFYAGIIDAWANLLFF